MTVHELARVLKQHWPAIRERLLKGGLCAATGETVEIPKPDGGIGKLRCGPNVYPRKSNRSLRALFMLVFASRYR